MKFIFTESFKIKDWNGYVARYVKGVSGSHSAPMYLAEGLAAKGHEVEFVSINNNFIPTSYLNVKYTNLKEFEPTMCDYIITTNYTTDLAILNKIRELKKIILLMHNDLVYNEDKLHEHIFKQFDKSKILIAYLSMC